ncbi:hypothetical protein RD792_000738 [Penstemon davidsonii]|uniref:F-box domain-containing protein n=1 Tax=Penstemon davidsonii TaxID=160366 RepID=A0ABR0DLI0_9LAMI|nr:hypothetical protein RD792_000738 [Penstemon davidsonii]
MGQPFFTNLPSEIIIDILSRLPIKAIISCKCVCKSWSVLLETPEFVNSHLLKSIPGLIFNPDEVIFSVFEFVDELELVHHDLFNNIITKVHRMACLGPPAAHMDKQGSADGLLFLREINPQPNLLYICNPITREYIKLPNPDSYRYPSVVTYGFGVSKTSNKYKVVRIFHECVRDPTSGSLLSIPKSECKVYTLGTGSWRSIPPGPGVSYEYNCRSTGTLFNGNLLWLVVDLKASIMISYFDLETELFNTFLPPPPLLGRINFFLGSLVVLENCLCLCDNTSDYEIVIWVMKKSWTKEFTISKVPNFAGESWEIVYPMKIFKNGDILMTMDNSYPFYYSKQSKTLQMIGNSYFEARLHVSSFLSLKTFAEENVISY